MQKQQKSKEKLCHVGRTPHLVHRRAIKHSAGGVGKGCRSCLFFPVSVHNDITLFATVFLEAYSEFELPLYLGKRHILAKRDFVAVVQE